VSPVRAEGGTPEENGVFYWMGTVNETVNQASRPTLRIEGPGRLDGLPSNEGAAWRREKAEGDLPPDLGW
jgi:hypothetical protein